MICSICSFNTLKCCIIFLSTLVYIYGRLEATWTIECRGCSHCKALLILPLITKVMNVPSGTLTVVFRVTRIYFIWLGNFFLALALPSTWIAKCGIIFLSSHSNLAIILALSLMFPLILLFILERDWKF